MSGRFPCIWIQTLVVERRHEIGGGLATEETLFPGFYTNPHAIYHLMVDYIPVLKDFNLTNHGVTFVKPNLQTAQVFGDGSSLVLCRQVEDTKDSMAKFSPMLQSYQSAIMEADKYRGPRFLQPFCATFS